MRRPDKRLSVALVTGLVVLVSCTGKSAHPEAESDPLPQCAEACRLLDRR